MSEFFVILLVVWAISGMCILGLRSDPVRSNTPDIRPEESLVVVVFVGSSAAGAFLTLILLLRFLTGGAA